MSRNLGFTLIELSIVLVIIGLIVGGILTGSTLIDAAAQRAQISQIEHYQTAMHTFQNKYGYLPGDIPDPYASNFGFQGRGQYRGEGDDNGLLEGNCNNNTTGYSGFDNGCGELAVFWQDLSTASLIDAGIAKSGSDYPKTASNPSPDITMNSATPLRSWLPVARIGSGTIFVYEFNLNGANYFAVSSVDTIGYNIQSAENPGLTVLQAYNIDHKTDDGLPQSGNVTACYSNYDVTGGGNQGVWAAGNNQQGANGGSNCTPTTNATTSASTNCYDNGDIAGTQMYSLTQNSNLQNCALSFRFQ